MINKENLWSHFYNDEELALDYSGRLIAFEHYGDSTSPYGWNIEHINPKSNGGSDKVGNLVPSSIMSNMEKNDDFPHWFANGKSFRAEKKNKNNPSKGYNIIFAKSEVVEFVNK